MNFLKMDAKSFVRDGIFVFFWRSSSPCDALPRIGRPSGTRATYGQRVGGVARVFCLDRFIGMLGWSSMVHAILCDEHEHELLPAGHCKHGFNVTTPFGKALPDWLMSSSSVFDKPYHSLVSSEQCMYGFNVTALFGQALFR